MVVRRNYEQAITDISWHVSKKLSGLIKKRYFKVVVEKLLQPKYKSCRAALNESLGSQSLRDLVLLRKESLENFNFYLYITVASFREADTDQLEAYLKKVRHFVPFESAGSH